MVLLPLLITACSEGPSPTAPSAPSYAIFDAAHGGLDHFYFLPPMVPEPSPSGVFDATAAPVVQICEVSGSDCGLVIAMYDMTSGPGSETVRVVPDEEHFVVNWHTDQFDLDVLATYRVRVLVDDYELGYADVDPVDNGAGLRNVDTGEYVALKDGRTLPVRFRIEEGAINGEPPDNSVSGTVTDEAGVPLPGILVRVLNAANLDLLAFVNTDDQGRYTVDPIPPDAGGTYGPVLVQFLDASASAYTGPDYVWECYNDVSGVDAACLAQGTAVARGSTGVDAQLTRNSVSGTVTDEAGVPLPGIMVRVLDVGSFDELANVLTDDQGHYTVEKIQFDPGGAFGPVLVQFLDASASAYTGPDYVWECYNDVSGVDAACLAQGTAVARGSTGVDAQLTRNSVSGTVTDEAGVPLPGIMVRVLGATTGNELANVLTNDQGQYTAGQIRFDAGATFGPVLVQFLDVPASPYTGPDHVWECHDNVASDLATCQADGTAVQRGTTGVDAQLTRNSVGGTVTDQAGTPLPGIVVRILGATTGNELAFVLTDAQGRYAADQILLDSGGTFGNVLVQFIALGFSEDVWECYDNVAADFATCLADGTSVDRGSTGIDAVLNLPPPT